ncbi:MAG: hypothetical protein QXS85_05965 [Acidilobaceae archaeon]
MSSLWTRQPLVHVILEAIKKLAGSEGVVLESTLKSYLSEKEGIEVSFSDLSRALIVLEREGYIVVQLSTKDERIIRLRKT